MRIALTLVSNLFVCLSCDLSFEMEPATPQGSLAPVYTLVPSLQVTHQ